jgi:hypothetical protein
MRVASDLIVPLESCARPTRTQRVERGDFAAHIDEAQVKEPPRGDGDKRLSERSVAVAEGDGDALPFRLHLTGRHRIQRDDEVVKPAGAGKANRISGIEHRGVARKRMARGHARDRGEILLWRDARPAAEQPVEMKFREARMRCHVFETRLFAKPLVDESDGPRDAREVSAVYEVVGQGVLHGPHGSRPLLSRDPILAVAHGRRIGW